MYSPKLFRKFPSTSASVPNSPPTPGASLRNSTESPKIPRKGRLSLFRSGSESMGDHIPATAGGSSPSSTLTRSPKPRRKRSLFRFFSMVEDDLKPQLPTENNHHSLSFEEDSSRPPMPLPLTTQTHSLLLARLLPDPNNGDMRTHIVKELFDTEASYVENLQLMVHRYLRPLKKPEVCSLVESNLVDEIFFQIPEILGHHELFYAALKSRLDNWDMRQKIGDIILNNFTKQSVIDTYTAFINNWKNAKHAIRTACQSKPSFAKYLMGRSREHKNKLTLDALLIMPVQRIPRYELLIKELLKHTSMEHADHPLLLRAQKEIHELATKINLVEQEAGLSEQMQQRLREIEAIVDGLDELVSPERVFYRYDLVSVFSHVGKKERCMFLFNDLVLITNVKRKNTAALRKSAALMSPTGHNFLENNKFKLLMKISLDDLEVTKNSLSLLNRIQEEVRTLQDDLRVLGKIYELTFLLKTSHDNLEKEIDKLREDVRQKLADKHTEMTTNPILTSLDLLVTTEEGVETLTVTFPSADKRVAWEKCFSQAKEALTLSLSKRPPPVFLKPLALQRTRAGLHFTCASPTLGKNDYGYPNVWICNSDSHVGQVCLLNLTPEPDLASCNGISNATILCICAVPVSRHSQYSLRRMRRRSTSTVPSGNFTVGAELDTNLELDSDSSENEEGGEKKEEEEKISTGSVPSIETPLEAPKDDVFDPSPLMWIGTEDGCILVFNFNDNIRTRKNRIKIQHSSPITAMVYADDRVFVALGSGELIFYDRDREGGGWEMAKHRTLDVAQPLPAPISAMLTVTSRLWCSSQNKVIVFHPITLHLEHSFSVSSDAECWVECMASGGLGVWLAIRGSPVLKLHHVLSFEPLLEINVCPIVTKTLVGCDDIIRQHKLARLRVTALMSCKDQLWVGTSAGVILTLPLPHLSHNTTRLSSSPSLSVCPIGHSGQCRFLTSVDLQQGLLSRSASHTGSFTGINEPGRRRMSLNVAALQQGKVYVISGGDGFEDFQDVSTDDGDETAGREDSTNHLLIWQI